MKKQVFRVYVSYFLKGIVLTVPLVITIWFMVTMFNFLDNLLPTEITGLGIIILVVLLTVIGAIGSTFLGRVVSSYFNEIIDKVPLLKVIYTAVKSLLSAFVGDQRKFTQPVLVKMGDDVGLEKLGFITEENLAFLGIPEGKIAVLLPHSYNFSGNIYVVSEERITRLNAQSQEVMKFIMSGGVTGTADAEVSPLEKII